jgi:mRNA interferase HigB
LRVIRSERLVSFGKRHADARKWLSAWIEITERATWKNIQDVRKTFAAADAVRGRSGRVLTVFNVKGNRYRLIVAIDYSLGVVNVLTVMTHPEYSRDLWKDNL